MRELWARARSCWTKILTHESKSILVVAHNAVNQALVATALGIVFLCFVQFNVNVIIKLKFFILVWFLLHVGLGTEYFRFLLQSNCGVSVLDFTPKTEGGSPEICLNRLNQVYNLIQTGI